MNASIVAVVEKKVQHNFGATWRQFIKCMLVDFPCHINSKFCATLIVNMTSCKLIIFTKLDEDFTNYNDHGWWLVTFQKFSTKRRPKSQHFHCGMTRKSEHCCMILWGASTEKAGHCLQQYLYMVVISNFAVQLMHNQLNFYELEQGTFQLTILLNNQLIRCTWSCTYWSVGWKCSFALNSASSSSKSCLPHHGNISSDELISWRDLSWTISNDATDFPAKERNWCHVMLRFSLRNHCASRG